MMKKVFYLTAPLVILALFVLGCGQGAPNASSGNEVVPKIDAPAVPSVDEAVPQLTPELVGNPNGNCCPQGFDIEIEVGNPADHNGDDHICRKVTAAGAITIDNNAPGDCFRCPDGSVRPCTQ
ncbi:MAG: hypothetical protein IH914_04895 [candidate division Zixibacteria bacterium]|nr:hypothetical protein [candidate division Zixibacteria bacterium]